MLFFVLPVWAQDYTGWLIAGGGVDDLFLIIKNENGQELSGYCDKASVCSDWDALFKEDENGAYVLKRKYFKKKVRVRIIERANNGEIAGPSDDEVLPFITQFRFLD